MRRFLIGAIGSAFLGGLIGCHAPQNRHGALTPPIATRPATMPSARAYTERLPGTELAIDMVPIPGGRFRMGSPDSERGRKPHEGPQAEVVIEPFYMSKFEITWDLYNEFMAQYSRLASERYRPLASDKLADAVTYPSPIYTIEFDPAAERMGGRRGKYPAIIMSRYSAQQFTKWLSKRTGRFYRLPSEAEWEYACRAGSTTAYSFGDDPKKLGEYAWFEDNSGLKSNDDDPAYRLVGQKKPNAWGLYDMHGNVAEWVVDQYEENYARLSTSQPVKGLQSVRFPDKRYPCIYRGGGYESDAAQCRSAARMKGTVSLNQLDAQDPKSIYYETNGMSIGFRIVSPIREPSEAEKLRWWDMNDPETLAALKSSRALQEIIPPPATRRAR
jgi:formylglycine-generating enzyme required for sulfatase activity